MKQFFMFFIKILKCTKKFVANKISMKLIKISYENVK